MIKGIGDLLNRAAQINHLHGAGYVAGPFYRRTLIAMPQTRSIAAASSPTHALSALRPLNYRLCWCRLLASVMAHVAQSWFVLGVTHMPLLPTLTGLIQAIPTITLTLVGGVIAGTDAKFASAPIAGIVGGVLVAGSALPIVLSKQIMQRLEPPLAVNEMLASM
jgi:hypothetical protein